MWRKLDAAVASLASTVGVLAQIALLLAWGFAKAVAIMTAGVVIVCGPLYAVYRWSGGSAGRYFVGAAVVVGALTALPEVVLRRHRRASKTENGLPREPGADR